MTATARTPAMIERSRTVMDPTGSKKDAGRLLKRRDALRGFQLLARERAARFDLADLQAEKRAQRAEHFAIADFRAPEDAVLEDDGILGHARAADARLVEQCDQHRIIGCFEREQLQPLEQTRGVHAVPGR